MTNDSSQGTLIYDDAGNLTQGYTKSGQPFTAAYDAENRLASIEYTDGGTIYKTTFVYGANDFLGQIKQFENSTMVSDVRIVRNGLLSLQERDASNQVVREYTWGANKGGGIGGLLNLNQNGMDYTYYYDGKGNVSAILDTSQTAVAAYRYGSFGEVLTTSGTLDQPFQFSTKRYFSDVGFNYYGYRFYYPAKGKWLTRDPLFEDGGINLYGFVQNNPVNLVDPWGLAWRQKRPLNIPGFQDFTTGLFHHDRLLFDDGTESGYYSDSRVKADPAPNRLKMRYENVGEYLQDDILRDAVNNVKPRWDYSRDSIVNEYDFLNHNCQDYVDAVIEEYNRIQEQMRNNDSCN